MSTFTPEFLDEIRRRVSIAEVVGRTVRLKERARGDFWGLSPFTNEKTPSFHVMEDKGFYKCFSTQNSGDVFTFLIEVGGMSFPEAVEQLAAEAGLEMPQNTPEERQRSEKRKTLADVNEHAADFFEKMLRMPEGRGALEYLKRRGLDDATIKTWRLGFAPDSRGALKAALTRDGVAEELMIEAGLLRVPDNGDPYDWFRGRVMFPIQDRRGGVIAFGGRILGDGEPKYLNSPETPLFQKRHALYGMHLAGAPARKAGRMIVCEGYMDVIGLARAGIDNAVAPLGTALTEDQLRDLWRVVREPVMCFDGDVAGQKAAFRAAERALPIMQAGHALRFAILPAGEDPDSLVAAKGRGAFDELLTNALPLSEMIWREVTGGRMPQSPEDRADVQQKLDQRARDISDATFRRHFSDYFSRKLWGERGTQPQSRGGGKFTPRKGFGKTKVEGAVMADARAETSAATPADTLRERILLSTLINHPEIFDEIEEHLGMLEFSTVELDNVRQRVLNTLARHESLDSEELRNHLSEEGLVAEIGMLLSKSVYMHARFARADSDVKEALEGWLDTYQRLTAKDHDTELRQAEAALGEDTTEMAFGRMKALKA
ncbi:DNA primase [Thalassospiraceae bacterium LMO-JJ14]|nr:DNA primase [Thalassospiraceae bacterium LMO-JJ14]